MKKTASFAVAAVCLAFIMVGCGSGGAGGDGGYYVSFTANGTDYVLSRGYTDDTVFDSGANGAVSETGTAYYITASGEDVTNKDQGPYFALRFENNAPGTYDNTQITDGMVGFTVNGTDYYEVSDQDFTLILESFGSVGGAIEGTFSGVLKEWDNNTHTYTNTLTIENGYFYVERLADGAIAAPKFFQ